MITRFTEDHGQSPERVAVTHPAWWAAEEIDALAAVIRPLVPGAGRLYGFSGLLAAAVGYLNGDPTADADSQVAVLDVGATGS